MIREFKQDRIQSVMETHNLELLIASLPENIYYLSGYRSISHAILNRVQAYAIYRPGNAVEMVLPFADSATFYEQCKEIYATFYGKFYFAHKEQTELQKNLDAKLESSFMAPAEALISAIKKAGVRSGNIGVDEGRLTPETLNAVKQAFPRVQFVSAAGLFGQIRMIKHPEEVQLLEKAVAITEIAMYSAIKEIRHGITETEIANHYIKHIVEHGAQPFFNVVTIDNRSAYADTITTEQSVKDGSIIRFDMGCIYKGYRSDIARTVVVGNHDPRVAEYYNSILMGEEKAVDAIKPGVSVEEIFNIAVTEVKKGIPKFERHHCGHGIGLEVYDPPSIAPGVADQLQSGMVLCVETPYYELGWGGVQVEDTIVVTENGSRYLTKSSRELIKVGL